MDIDYHFIRDRVAAKALWLSFCSLKDQIADGFTKLICTNKFHLFRMSLNVVNTPLDPTGRINVVPDQPTHFHKQLECISDTEDRPVHSHKQLERILNNITDTEKTHSAHGHIQQIPNSFRRVP